MKLIALVFVTALLPGAAMAWPTLAVTGVPKGDVLNLRAAPDAKSAIVAKVPRDARAISANAVGVKGTDWLRITYRGKTGWANAKFLNYETGGGALPVRLQCGGTEPFWSVNVGYGRGDADLSYEDRKQTLALDAPIAAMARPNLWVLPAVRGGDFLHLEKKVCSDDMSDTDYAYTASVRVGGTLLSGCCR